MALGVHGVVMEDVQRHVVLDHKQEVVLVTIQHQRMVENSAPVKVRKQNLATSESVQV